MNLQLYKIKNESAGTETQIIDHFDIVVVNIEQGMYRDKIIGCSEPLDCYDFCKLSFDVIGLESFNLERWRTAKYSSEDWNKSEPINPLNWADLCIKHCDLSPGGME